MNWRRIRLGLRNNDRKKKHTHSLRYMGDCSACHRIPIQYIMCRCHPLGFLSSRARTSPIVDAKERKKNTQNAAQIFLHSTHTHDVRDGGAATAGLYRHRRIMHHMMRFEPKHIYPFRGALKFKLKMHRRTDVWPACARSA